MTRLELFLLALALAADAFSVGAAVGFVHGKPRQIFRLSWHFGLFQSLFALAGYLAGTLLLTYMTGWDHWVAGGILTILGIRMMIGAVFSRERARAVDLTRGWSLVGLSAAVSVDALAAGVGLAAVRISAWFAITVIGTVSSLATLLAMILAARIGRLFGPACELAAGGVLLLMGIRIILG